MRRLKNLNETWQTALVGAVAIPVFYVGYFLILPHFPEGLGGWLLIIPFILIMLVSGIFATGAILWFLYNALYVVFWLFSFVGRRFSTLLL